MKKAFFWFRRDLRLHDNHGLFEALNSGYSIIPIFIFDQELLNKLPDRSDRRVQFIHRTLTELQRQIRDLGSELVVRYGSPLEVYRDLLKEFQVEGVYLNRDHDPYPRRRDQLIKDLFEKDMGFFYREFQDHFIFERTQVLKDNGTPYTIFTPYSKKWLAALEAHPEAIQVWPSEQKGEHFSKQISLNEMPSLTKMGFSSSELFVAPPHLDPETLKNYEQHRGDVFNPKATTQLGVHLRFGTISPREVVRNSRSISATFLSEIAWRDFFSQILWHFPQVVKQSFRPEFDRVEWSHNEEALARWKEGQTGFPLVDAGMRQLRQTGQMPNRVRMNVASFLCKDLLIHWSQGERYFAGLLLDYDLSANNGNWQWAAGTGCDAAPYFRVFNPELQRAKFDPKEEYIRQWIPEWKTTRYPAPMVDHAQAARNAIAAYSKVKKPKDSEL